MRQALRVVGLAAAWIAIAAIPGYAAAGQVSTGTSVSETPLASKSVFSANAQFAAIIAQLPSATYSRKAELIDEMAQIPSGRVKTFLEALLNENVYSTPKTKRVVIASEGASGYTLTNPVTGRSAGTASEDAFYSFNEVGINDHVRSVLQRALEQINLSSDNPKTRLAAVRGMLRAFAYSYNPQRVAAAAALLRAHLGSEHNEQVRKEIEVGLALAALGSGNSKKELAAIRGLRSSMAPEVYNRLASLSRRAAGASATVRTAAELAVRHIDDLRNFYGGIQTLAFGLGLGAVLALASIGLAITFGVMGVINMAHGELIMIGAYTTYVMQLLMPNHIGTALVLAVPAAFMVSGLSGVAIERGIVRFLYSRPLETLLATFGVSLMLQELARDIFSPENMPVTSPGWMMGSVHINEALTLTHNRLYVLVFMSAVFAILLLVMKRSRLGLQIRAVSQNRPMARAMGVRTQWVDALAFGLGSGLAGLAGVALSQLTNVGPDLGQSYIVDCFMVVVFGGVGNLWGTVIASMILGILEMVLQPYAGAVLGKVLVLVAVILFIQRRPRGLFPQRGRAAEA